MECARIGLDAITGQSATVIESNTRRISKMRLLGPNSAQFHVTKGNIGPCLLEINDNDAPNIKRTVGQARTDRLRFHKSEAPPAVMTPV